MKPRIIKSRFGKITIQHDGQLHEYTYDILLRLDGGVHRRKKMLSKQVYGTSHTLSLAEAQHVYETGAEQLLIATGVFDRVRLSDEAADFFRQRNVTVHLHSTPRATSKWNEMSGKVIGLFHISC